jgi:hypothetical protein
MVPKQRGVPLVRSIVAQLKKRAPDVIPATAAGLDSLESKLMVEIPPTLKVFLEYDFLLASFGAKFEGRHRFGQDARNPHPKITSVRKIAERMAHLGWSDSRVRTKLVRLPNRKKEPWNALYLGEARRDGELVILGLEADDSHVRTYVRYTSFDLYLADQLAGVMGWDPLDEDERLEDLESHLATNPELGSSDEDDDGDQDY